MSAASDPSGPSEAPGICLCMIVKNESAVIGRCLDSVKGLLSRWVVVDTGSTDGTQDLVRAHLAGIPGDLHERPWRDFASNRTEAIGLARGKAAYLLVVDADDVLAVSPSFSTRGLDRDAYELRVEDQGHVYYRTHLFRSDAGFRYEGVVHETLVAPGGSRAPPAGRLEGLVYRRLGGGARSTDPEKFKKDAALLEKALLAEPQNTRYAFYLAQSYKDAGLLAEALAAYDRRARMGGWGEEVSASLTAAAGIMARLGRGDDEVIAAYLRAYESRPERAEPLVYLAAFCRGKGRMALAHVFASAARDIPRPAADVLWVDEGVYAWRALDEYAISAFYVGRHEEAIRANDELLAGGHLPAFEVDRVRANRGFSVAALGRAT